MLYELKEAEGRVGWVQGMDKAQLNSETLLSIEVFSLQSLTRV